MEKRYLVKISFRAEKGMHPEEFEVYGHLEQALGQVDR